MARPTALTPARREAIEQALSRGAPLSVAAEAGGVSKRAVSYWLQSGVVVRRELSAVPEPGEPAGAGAPDEEAIERSLVGAVLRASANDWRAASWLLDRRWPRRYGRR